MLNIAITSMMFLIALSNYFVQFPINRWLTWGAFIYPITYLVTELVNRFYGPAQARRVVWFGFVLSLIISIFIFPWRIGVASCGAFLLSQLLDISIFTKLRDYSWWKAPFFASLIATLLDTWVFFFIAFYGEPFPWITVAIGDFLVKFGVDVICLLPFRIAIYLKNPGVYYSSENQ